MRHPVKRLSLAIVAMVVSFSVVALSVSAKPVTVAAGNIVLTLDGKVSPKALSRTEPTPITFQFSAGVKTKDGTHAPAAQNFEAEVDRSGALNPTGLPVCRTQDLEARTTEGAKQACKDSLVGQGFAEAEVEFPEQLPFDAEGPLLLFNGGTKGRETLLLAHVYANVPAPTAFVTPIHVTKINAGKYGLKIEAKIPVIAGGSGSLSRVAVTNRKIFTYKGEKQSYFLAKCPTGRLFGRGKLDFSDGTRLLGTLSLPCTPKG
jgi:hypothetical protein